MLCIAPSAFTKEPKNLFLVLGVIIATILFLIVINILEQKERFQDATTINERLDVPTGELKEGFYLLEADQNEEILFGMYYYDYVKVYFESRKNSGICYFSESGTTFANSCSFELDQKYIDLAVTDSVRNIEFEIVVKIGKALEDVTVPKKLEGSRSAFISLSQSIEKELEELN